MKTRIKWPQLLAGMLFVAACVIGILAQRRQQPEDQFIPRARWGDKAALGGKGLRLLLERLGYRVQRVDGRLATMPAGAKVWLILDPQTHFSKAEAEQLLAWVDHGGTLVWAVTSDWQQFNTDSAARKILSERLGIESDTAQAHSFDFFGDEPLPPLVALTRAAAADYWSGVQQATASGYAVTIKHPTLEIAGTAAGAQLARLDYGKGRVFVAPDALLFTNYALGHPDNAVLVTNLLRVHVPPGRGTVYFDERQHGEAAGAVSEKPSLLYYLWQPPLRWALLQLLGAALLLWACYGRRLGAPVPLPDQEPVTRAGHFALAMGALFQKVNRPRAAGTILGEEFRRALVRRLGLSPQDSDAAIAQRAAEVTGLPAAMIDRLLLQARAPAESEAEALSDAQEMELVLRRLGLR